ncbi:MAG TPA: pyridoxamine 5'-phosphate oxidase [Bacteroidota bacterium]|nr:pyridoxamine 5'-phosphate oxidase [Bacteroidota bacterium]
MKITLWQILKLARNIRGGLDEQTIDPDPIRQFQGWLKDAVDAKLMLPESMALATAGADGKPSARMVLLKSADERGFVFFTNYNSRKAKELDATRWAALTFHWVELHRQVRIEGTAARISAEESDAYFATRPRESQLGAYASPQSDIVASREALDQNYKRIEELYRGKPIPRPFHWGGYRVKPVSIEFWKGRFGRLHDRILYDLQPDGSWGIKRLAP